jgi:hypothetical protein
MSASIDNWTYVYMKVFTQNNRYYNLPKYLLFLLKHPVCYTLRIFIKKSVHTNILSVTLYNLQLIPKMLTNTVEQEPEALSPHSQQPATGPCPEPVESNPLPPPPKPVSLRSILIPSSHLRLGLPSGLFPSGFPTKTVYRFLSSPMRATFPAHFIRHDVICLMISGDDYKLRSSIPKMLLIFYICFCQVLSITTTTTTTTTIIIEIIYPLR